MLLLQSVSNERRLLIRRVGNIKNLDRTDLRSMPQASHRLLEYPIAAQPPSAFEAVRDAMAATLNEASL